MPVTVSDAEYIEGIAMTPLRCLIDHASWVNVPAGTIVRDIIERFVTPKCYLVVPGVIADGEHVSLSIGEEIDGRHTPEYRNVASVLHSLAIVCEYRWHITLDGRVHFGPV